MAWYCSFPCLLSQAQGTFWYVCPNRKEINPGEGWGYVEKNRMNWLWSRAGFDCQKKVGKEVPGSCGYEGCCRNHALKSGSMWWSELAPAPPGRTSEGGVDFSSANEISPFSQFKFRLTTVWTVHYRLSFQIIVWLSTTGCSFDKYGLHGR